MKSLDRPLLIGSLLYEGIDQIDLTGPFEVLTRLPSASLRIYGVEAGPVRDLTGLVLTPEVPANQRALRKLARLRDSDTAGSLAPSIDRAG